MRLPSRVVTIFLSWIDCVAGTAARLLDRFSSPRSVVLVEEESGEFILRQHHPEQPAAGERVRFADGRIVGVAPSGLTGLTDLMTDSRVDIVLQRRRFLVQPLELPRRATEFLAGIVRTQIDQLTPWSADHAAFGWSKPIESGPERIVIIVAATALELVTPYVQAIAALKARSIAVFTSTAESGPDVAPIKVLERALAEPLQFGRLRRALMIAFVSAGMAAAAGVAASITIGATLDAQQVDLARQIAIARGATASGRGTAASSAAAALRSVGERKHDVPSAVIVLDALSQILPDHTYVTELRLEQDKVQLTGVTRDAPSLIGLLEQSGRFTRATFFAPTTRAPSEPGERFHIEAHVQAIASPRS